jgi:NAD(P)-dependent dehydrogenase (short-subunit alcohol dehydrogenase family)
MGYSSRIAVVTGATGGIGRWIALGVALAGYHIVLVCRDIERGKSLSAWIAQKAPGSTTELGIVDLSSLRDTKRIGEDIAGKHPKISLLINNAGMFSARHQLTAEGHERVLAVNHLAPLVLADTLEDALRSAAPSRIVNVGSSTSDRAKIDPADLELTQGWGMLRSYSRSKLAMMMSTFARAELLRSSGVVANVVHPGAVATGLIKEGGPIGAAWKLMAPFLLTEEQGADTPLHVALASEWSSITGAYVKNRVSVLPNPLALDPTLVARVDSATRLLIA